MITGYTTYKSTNKYRIDSAQKFLNIFPDHHLACNDKNVI